MFDEPINDSAARLVLGAFPTWGEPDPDEPLVDWTRWQLARGKWSSAEQAVLELAAGLLAIEDYDATGYDGNGGRVIERRAVPPLGLVLSACFDPERRAHVLAALELAVVGERPIEWRWVTALF